MTTELQMLLWTVVLGLVQIAVSASISTHTRGIAWNVGARDDAPKPLTAVGGRLDRALRNLLETFPFFAVAVLAVTITQRGTPHSALGAQIYFWSRVAFVPVYAAGIPYLRTLIWGASIFGLLMVLSPVL
ncbi:MAG TPA: MAPEG family protein [Arenimonas sp.]|uniref:MAPEG family protein n=1 Tax=Arenimonas sp. TaxID=1872635 RepID=UPI002BE9C871|nr:MAPEG family protein [Arenimonas sp.]HMB56521.1 MAPEG family protein [Arenimonas sp.]